MSPATAGARLVLGIDIGSSSAEAVLADSSGVVVGHAELPQTVARTVPGVAEQAADDWWQALRGLVGATVGTLSAGDRARLIGVAISSHFPTLLLTDDEGRPLRPALLYGDQRADGYVAPAATLGGETLAGDEWLPKLLWLADEAPDVLARTRFVFNPNDYLAYLLTGERATNHRTARRSGGLFDPHALAWRPDVCRRVGLDPDSLPPLRNAGEVIGCVTPTAARESGLPAGTPVVVGLGDTPSELLGAGVVRRDDVLLYYGTTTSADLCTHDFERYLRDPSSIAAWGPYHEVAYAVLGPALAWIAGGFDGSGEGGQPWSLDRLDRAAASIRPSVDDPYVLPYFLAHPRAGEVVRRPAIVGFDVRHSRADLHRAVLESFGFAARAGLEAAGHEIGRSRFVASGGGAQSPFWRQLVTDILGADQAYRPTASAALGSAALAAWATGDAGVFAGIGWGAPSDATRTTPVPGANEIETERYRIWLQLRAALRGPFPGVPG